MASTLVGKEYTIYRNVEGKLSEASAKIPEIGPHDVVIKITHSGVCYTDLLLVQGGHPLAVGHEGVGVVEAVGSAVTSLKVGDRAGGGFHKDSCGSCKYCQTGQDLYCYNRTIYGFGDINNGTFGAYYVGKEGYVHKIPDNLSSADAAPLQCAGATVYSALVDIVKPTQRVGVVGIGGLGHLAIQFAAKMGAEVVVFSTSKDKEEEALGFGASEFVLLSEVDKVKAPVDILIVSSAKEPEWEKFLDNKVLARRGTIVPLTAPHGPYVLSSDKFFWEGYTLHASLVASKQQHSDMLQFAALKGIKPTNQVYKLEGVETIETIFKKLSENSVRYRAVLEL